MQTAAGNGNHDCADGIIEIVEDIKKLWEEFTLLEDKKSKLEMDKTEDGEYSSGTVEFITEKAEKMELPQSKYVERNRLRRHNARPSPYQTPPLHPSEVYNLRSKHAQEKPEQPPKLTPRLKVEDVRRHITYKLNQEESKMVDRWRDHSFGRNGGDNARYRRSWRGWHFIHKKAF